MKSTQTPIALLIFIFCLVGISSSTRAHGSASQNRPKCLIPQATWEPLFFQDINQRARRSKLPNLRSYCLPHGDIEIRIWEGFGLTYLEGIRLRRTCGIWSGRWLYGAMPKFRHSRCTMRLFTPVSGWKELWKQLEQGGIARLPDASRLKYDHIAVFDGIGYVVEINENRVYRTYCYENPESHQRPEDQQMVKLIKIINKEFGLEEKKRKLYHYAGRPQTPR